jgi:hypothetical protein
MNIADLYKRYPVQTVGVLGGVGVALIYIMGKRRSAGAQPEAAPPSWYQGLWPGFVGWNPSGNTGSTIQGGPPPSPDPIEYGPPPGPTDPPRRVWWSTDPNFPSNLTDPPLPRPNPDFGFGGGSDVAAAGIVSGSGAVPYYYSMARARGYMLLD